MDQIQNNRKPEALTPEQLETRIDRLLVIHLNRSSVSRAEAEQYLQERPVLKNLIREAADQSAAGTPSKIITRGVLDLSRWRVQAALDEGYRCVCGTYLNRCRERLGRWLEFHFPEQELERFLRYCAEPDAETELCWEKLLLLLILQTPAMLIRKRKISDYYGDT